MDRLVATFIGIEDNNSIYLFEINSEKKRFYIKKTEQYYIQNRLIPTFKYFIEVDGNTIIDVEFYDKSNIKGIIKNYTPGLKTIKNFIKILLAPLGNTLYIYGGGWNIQDHGASFITKTIGVFPYWENFYNNTDANYSYKNDTYPKNGWNEYYYAGLDCAGYIGWAIYNMMNTQNEINDGFVYKSSILAQTLANHYNFGVWERPNTNNYKEIINMLHPGDIISIEGHVYAVIGKCSDDSAVIIHSTVSPSITGVKGGGVQLSALNPNNASTCDAYKLIQKYMEQHYGQWVKRYPPVMKPVEIYLDFSKEDLGIFSWHINEGNLMDPEGIRNMDAKNVLIETMGE